jgi:thiol-disulfide isomerase/thioredoxin
VRAKAPSVLAILISLIIVSAGCLTDDGDDDDDNGGLPHVGTTEGFLFPDITMETAGIGENRVRDAEADVVVIQVVESVAYEEDIRLQFGHFGPVRSAYLNLSKVFITVVAGPDVTMTDLEGLANDHSLDNPSIVVGDVVDKLSIRKFPTVFLLDERKVIFLRSDGHIGQGKMVAAIEEQWELQPEVETGLDVGDRAPSLLWRNLTDKWGWLENYRGSVVIINVWEFECPFCLLLMEELRQVYLNYSDQGLKIISIDHNPDDTDQRVQAVIDEYNATWSFAIDSDNIQSRYDIWEEPVVYLLDRGGVIRWHNLGLIDSSVIAGEVEKLI